MTTEERLRELILSRYRSILEFTQSIEMPYATMTSIFKRGIHNSSVTNIIKICQALGISADELANERIVPIDMTVQRRTHMTEINDIVTFTRKNMSECDDMTLDGQKMTKIEAEMLLDALEIGIGIIRRNRSRIKQKEGISKK